MTDWSDVENVRREWPAEDLDADKDLTAWREGNQIYDANQDYGSMMRAGALMSRALRHSLHGGGLLAKDDLMQTTHRVLFSSAFPPPDGRTLLSEAAAQLRLALTIVKKEGWQSREQGGDGTMGEFLQASWAILGCAIAPAPDRPWEGDLRRFFTSQPLQIPDTPPDLDPDPDRSLASVGRAIVEADRGDPANEARVRGMAAALSDEREVALGHYLEGAQLGDIDSMFDAGTVAWELGRHEQGLLWLERAAGGGHPGAMYNLGVAALGRGDAEAAALWWEKAGAAGDPGGYAALTQLASDRGDDANEHRWAKLGADMKQPFCMLRHGQLLIQSNPTNRSLIDSQAIPLLKAAADSNEHRAHFLLGIAYAQIDDWPSAQHWLLRAEGLGDQDATRVLDELRLR